jgi:hypothetical protein
MGLTCVSAASRMHLLASDCDGAVGASRLSNLLRTYELSNIIKFVKLIYPE